MYIYGTTAVPKLIKNSCSSSSAAQFVYPPIRACQEDLQILTSY